MSVFEEIGFLAENPSNIDPELDRLFNKLTNIANKLNVYSQKYQYNLHPQNNNRVQLFSATMLARSLSTYQGILLLAQKGMVHQTNMLVRCLMEVVFRLKALAIDSSFIDRLRIDENCRDMNKIESFIKVKNIHGIKDDDYYHALKTRSDIRLEKKEVNPNKVGELTIAHTAKLAKMTDAYLLHYSLYSDDIHCSSKSLMSHFLFDADNQITALKNEPSTDNYEDCISYSIYLMLVAIESTNILFNDNNGEEFEEIRTEIEKTLI